MHLEFAISLALIARLVASDPQNQHAVLLSKPKTSEGIQEYDEEYSMVINIELSSYNPPL